MRVACKVYNGEIEGGDVGVGAKVWDVGMRM